MLMTAVHMDSSSSSCTPPPPWLTVLTDHHHQLLHDFTPASASSPSPPPPAPSSYHHQLLPRASRCVAKRRLRPSRRLPTTYISADPASFRRMVHQVTGADDLPQPSNAAELLLTRPAPVRATSGPGGALINMLLPTLDTSAFLVDAVSRTETEALSKTRTDGPTCDGSAAGPALGVEAGGACNSRTGGGFPTLESWDHRALF